MKWAISVITEQERDLYRSSWKEIKEVTRGSSDEGEKKWTWFL